jgi:hypothetical protein
MIAYSINFTFGRGTVSGSAVNGWSALTVSFWLKAAADQGQFSRVFQKGSNSGSELIWYVSGTDFRILSSGGTLTAPLASFCDGSWHLVIYTQDSGGNAVIYSDNTNISSAFVGNPSETSNPLYIFNDSTNFVPFTGKLKDLQLYNRVITSGERATLFSGGDISATGLMVRYKTNDGVGNLAADSSTHTLPLTLDGNYSWSTDTPAQHPGGTNTPATVYSLSVSNETVQAGSPLTFTVAPDGIFETNTTFTPHCTSGVFNPTSLVWTSSDIGFKTFTWTPDVYGPQTITCTNDGGLPDPAGVVVTVPVAQDVIAVNVAPGGNVVQVLCNRMVGGGGNDTRALDGAKLTRNGTDIPLCFPVVNFILFIFWVTILTGISCLMIPTQPAP